MVGRGWEIQAPDWPLYIFSLRPVKASGSFFFFFDSAPFLNTLLKLLQYYFCCLCSGLARNLSAPTRDGNCTLEGSTARLPGKSPRCSLYPFYR